MCVSLYGVFSCEENITSFLIDRGYSFTSVAEILKDHLKIPQKDLNINKAALHEPLCYRIDDDFIRLCDQVKELIRVSKEKDNKRITLYSFYGWDCNVDPYYGFISDFRASTVFKARLKLFLKELNIISKNNGVYYERYHYLP